MKIVHMTVNGQPREVAVEEGESLTDTLRERLGLTSVKKGCEAGECGACTVLIDGKAVNSCIYLAVWAEGKRILTVEGLRTDCGELHPVQKAFVEEAAVQCGFCTPGMVMAGKALIDKNPNPTEDEIKNAIRGNICRCTGYKKIIEGIELAAAILRGEAQIEDDLEKGENFLLVRFENGQTIRLMAKETEN